MKILVEQTDGSLVSYRLGEEEGTDNKVTGLYDPPPADFSSAVPAGPAVVGSPEHKALTDRFWIARERGV